MFVKHSFLSTWKRERIKGGSKLILFQVSPSKFDIETSFDQTCDTFQVAVVQKSGIQGGTQWNQVKK